MKSYFAVILPNGRKFQVECRKQTDQLELVLNQICHTNQLGIRAIFVMDMKTGKVLKNRTDTSPYSKEQCLTWEKVSFDYWEEALALINNRPL